MNALSRIPLLLASSIPVAVLVTGCGCGPATTPETTVVTCMSEGDCPAGSVCAFAPVDGCYHPGTCQMPEPTYEGCVSSQEVGCDCSGQTVVWQSGCGGLPSGMSPAPIAQSNACGS
jgi:hypothetical protein